MDVFRQGASESDTAVPKIAVLPLDNVGAAEDEWFANGITDEITSRLANVAGLEVIARQSTTRYKGSTKTIGEIARELDADYLIEGTVQTVHPDDGPAEVRIRPQLIKASDETHVWADVFTVRLLASEVFRVQTEVASHVARALNVTIQESGPATLRASPTSNTEALEFYMRGRERQVGAVTVQDLLIAVQMYEGAVELDRGFAVAYAALAEAHLHLWWRFYDRRAERLTSAKAALDRALELDSLLPEAQIALGYYHFWGLLEFEKALEVFETARATRPQSADLLYGIGSVHRRRGRLDEALTDLFRAAEVNPRSALVARDIANTYAFMRSSAEAERYFHHAISLDPGWPTYVRDAMRVHLRLEADLPGTRRILEEARSLGFEHPLLTTLSTWVEISEGNYQAALDLLATMSGDVAEANSFFIPKAQMYAEVYDLLGLEALRQAYYDSSRIIAEARLERMPDDPRVHSALGIAYAGLGRKEEALREGEQGVALSPVDKDAWQGVYRLESLAVINAMIGEHDKAIDLLDYLLSIPGTLTSSFLRIDYRFNALRDNPRFRAMLERHSG
jgi:serine/threonine-protein kinase